MSRNPWPAALLLSVSLLLSQLPHAHAHDTVVVVQPSAAPPVNTTTIVIPQVASAAEQPGLLRQAYRGLFGGGLSGLAIGYLAVRGGGVHHDEWRGLVLGSGIGVLAGTGLGLAMGMIDTEGASWSRYAMRDLVLGVTLGATLGAACGGLSSLSSSDPEHVLFGTAIGAVAGAPLGLIEGVLRASLSREQRTVHASVGVTRDVGGGHVWSPGVSGKF